MKRLVAIPLLALGLLAAPAFTGTPVVGDNGSALAQTVGVRIYGDNDRPYWRHRHFYRDRDDVIIRERYPYRYRTYDWD